ncbi:hypothetical protein [Shouchella lonarensis]|uniref:Uncharacterized protein n=1 Tax=Shouchella lonarensis TaxID=1464122 RepID=A0A1G6GGZ6_9BACI|nr:hypothetical protein [Shouchella lonarensis]SDB81281.1 hypothetical protein SAMN05421737_10147 [Shouchella lonarensis]
MNLKKMVAGVLVLMLVLSGFLSTPTFAMEGSQRHVEQEEPPNIELSQQDLILAVEPYVEVTNDGYLQLKDVPQHIYEAYQLDALQQHFDEVNSEVAEGNLAISSDLDVVVKDPEVGVNTVYGRWTYHWWGYDRKFDRAQTRRYISYLHSVAAGATIVAGASYFFPPGIAFGTINAGYFALLATRVDANNKGRGVYVGVTWVAIFRVTPL